MGVRTTHLRREEEVWDDLAPAGLLEELRAGAPEPVVGVVGGHDEAVVREGWWGGWMTVKLGQYNRWVDRSSRLIRLIRSGIGRRSRAARAPHKADRRLSLTCVRTVKRDAALPIVRDPKDVRLLCGCVVQSNRSHVKIWWPADRYTPQEQSWVVEGALLSVARLPDVP